MPEVEPLPSTPQSKSPVKPPSMSAPVGADSAPTKSSDAAGAKVKSASNDSSAMRGQAAILFTAFEPSGDSHAAPVIAQLRQEAPHLKVYAWGGPKMEAAGATILGRTAEDGAMGLGALKRAREVRREVKRIKQWIREYRVLAVVVVDSPAANFPIAKAVKKTGARVIHLVAPQLWAWGKWRLGKLRNCTDLVLCLLPFEEQWFNDRKVPAKFIGHPTVNRPLDEEELKQSMHGLPQGTPRIAVFPGSRSHEVKANIRLLANAYTELKGRFGGVTGIIAAANPNIAKLVRKKIKVFPSGMHTVTGMPDTVIAWCDIALAVSGTITLDIARQRKPMVGVYKTGIISWLGSKVLLKTPFCLLPNRIAEREIVPEFVPHIGGAMPIVKWAGKYLLDSKNAAIQSEELGRVMTRFANKKPAEEATRLILKVIKDGSV
jgi:lipid-A-disaccharide synthase